MKVIYTVIEKVEKNDYAQGGKIVNQRLEEVFNILPNEPEKKEELNNDIEDAIDNALVEYSAGMEITSKIDAALRRIDEGEYGYCEITGEPISLKRLDARPIATMTLEAQESHERREKVHRDD